MNFNEIDSLNWLWLVLYMTIKGFADNNANIETPNDVRLTEKPLKSEQINSKRVDINVLKSKLQETESKEFKKNVYILSSLILGLGVLGIYLSLWQNLQLIRIRGVIEIWKVLVLA